MELSQERGVQRSMTERLVRTRLQWEDTLKDGERHTTEESGRVTRAGQEETRETKTEMGGLF